MMDHREEPQYQERDDAFHAWCLECLWQAQVAAIESIEQRKPS